MVVSNFSCLILMKSHSILINSGEEVMSIYKVKKSWLYTSAKRNQIPMCRIAGKNYYSKRHIDEFFGTAVDLNSITEWVTADYVEDAFCMSKSALRAYAYRHKIPTKREYGRTYYSKEHLEAFLFEFVLKLVSIATRQYG